MPSRSHPARPVLNRHAILLAAAGMAALAPASRAVAQVQILPAPLGQQAGLPDDANKGKESNEPVYVRDSAVAQEKLTLAGRMERLKEWNKSADVYQEVLEKYRDRVVPIGTDAQGVINRYTSVRQEVLARLAKWPGEGLDVYRGRYEPKAAELVQNAKADDLFSLHKAYDLYFVTESGKAAGLRLVDAHLEKGEYAAAAQIGDQLLDTHPGLITEKPAVLFRTALAYHLAGNAALARQRADQLTAAFPKEMGVVKGKDALLTDALAAEMKRDAAAVAAVSGTDSWPTFGGSPSRGIVSPANASPGTRLVSIPLAKPQYGNMSAAQKSVLQQQSRDAAETGATLGIMPVADRGELFFQDGQRVYAVSLDSGLPLPGWAATHRDRQSQYVLPNAAAPARGIQQTLTLTDRFVLAVMGQPDRQGMTAGIDVQGTTRLVCLDRATGKEVWAATPAKAADVPKNEDEKAVRGLQLSGSPLVVGDSVLAIGRSAKPTQGEDCYVLAFDLATGKYRWGCYVASSGAGPGAAMGMGVPLGGDTTSHLAYADGRVYVLTNLGAVAALDAYSGTIAWLDLYPLGRPEVPANAGFGRGGGFNAVWIQGQMANAPKLKPWMLNPVVAQDGKLFVLPTEGKNLLIYDAPTGREVKRINLDQIARWHNKPDKQSDRPTTLVGVNGEKLVLAGESRVICIDWKAYDEEAFARDDAAVLWPSVVPGAIRGRCFLTDKSVYVPADDRLRRLDLDSQGSAVEEYPRWPRTWEDGEGPGNVLVTGDRVVVAGAGSVDVFTDLNAARRKLDRDLAAAPDDPDARLRYAEVMFVAGQTDVAVRRLDEAMALLGGADKMKPGPARDRAFTDALTFARKLAAAADAAGEAARAAPLFDRAGAAAGTPQQRVQYRLARAEFAQAQKQPAAAVGLYQEILSDAAMRAVALTDDQTGGPAQAEGVAEKAIDALVKASGPDVYAPFLDQATAAVARAKAEADPRAQAAQLLAVAQTYPNAAVAAGAILAAADAYEAAGDPAAALRVLRQRWFKAPKGQDRAAVLEGLARNYLTLPESSAADRVAAAAARLAQGDALGGDPKLAKALKLPDGTLVADAGATFKDALAAVRKVDAKPAIAVLLDFHLEIPQRVAGKPYPKPYALPAAVLPGATALVLPIRDFARTDRVVTWSAADGGVSIFAAGATTPLGTVKAFGAAGPDQPAAAARGVAWAGETALVWGGSKLVAVGPAGGVAWEIDFARLPVLDVVRPADVAPPVPQAEANFGINGAVINGPAINAQRVLLGRNGRVGARAGGHPPHPPPETPPPGDPLPPPAAGGEGVADVRPVGDRILVTTSAGRVLAAELATGRVAWQTRLDDNAPDRLAATGDFAVVKVSDDSFVRLVALDTYSGRLVGIKSYPVTGGGPTPVNLALSESGTLVYTLPDQLCLKDLYRDWDADEKVIPTPQGFAAYAGAAAPGQLVVADGRILAVAESSGGPYLGMIPGEKYVRVHSLETGQPVVLRYDAAGDGGRRQVDLVLQSGTKEWNVIVRVVGPHLYVVGPQSVYGYNLDRPAEPWKGVTNSAADRPQGDVNFREAFVGRDYLVVLDQPPPAADGRAGYRLHAYARYHQPGAAGEGESGKLDYSTPVTDPAGVRPQWQAADGGFYYATGDGKVRVLQGTRP